jgi:sulfite exporter TauE/SafE
MFVEDLVAGLLLGLSGGLYCLGWCALVMVPHLASGPGVGVRVGLWKVVEFSVGRLVTYLAAGASLFLVGQTLLASRGARAATGVLTVALAVLVLLQGVARSFPTVPGCVRLGERPWLRRYPLLGGMFSASHLCPPLLLCLAQAARAGGLVPALASTAGFFLGTTAVSLPLALACVGGRWPGVRATAAVASVFCGLWFAAVGVAMIVN